MSAVQPELATYLTDVMRLVGRYVVFPSDHEAVVVALWTAHAHLVEDFETSPILAVTSAEMRSGKTRVLDVLELLVPHPFRVVTPSEAVVYTVLARRPRPTMLLDEADAIFGARTAERYEGLRAILNAGNRQGTPVLRVNVSGRRREVDAFDVFGPKAIAGIGDLPATVTDRSIVLRMKRRAPSETVEKFRTRAAREQARGIACDWQNIEVAPTAEVPDELNDRAADSWEPLLAVADAAGGPWPALGRLAALALGSEEEAPHSVGIRLLADIRLVFGDEEHLPTSALLERLHALEDAPWGDWYGRALTARALAKLLSPYRVGPVKRRLDGGERRGYFRADLADAWRRYVPDTVPTVSTVSESASAVLPVVSQTAIPEAAPACRRTDATDETDATASEPVPDKVVTVWDCNAPTCVGCGRRTRAVTGRNGRYVCTFPHTAVATGGSAQ